MLLRFAVSNHLSIKDTQELSFIKSALKGPEDGLLSTPALPKEKVLPAAIIYGPNASGKTNLLDALAFMKTAILQSQRHWAPDAGVPRKPFALNQACASEPSRFEMDFVFEGVRHSYGFACTSSQFVEEWLYEAPNGRQRMIFERGGPLPEDMKFGASFSGPKQAIAQLMRPNSLFISTALQNNSSAANAVFFSIYGIDVYKRLETSAFSLSSILNNEEIDARILKFLENIETGITSHRIVDRDEWSGLDRNSFHNIAKIVIDSGRDSVSSEIRSKILEKISTGKVVEFGHRSENGSNVFFELERESAGTRRLIPLLQQVMTALDKGNICVIDEIDASLHTQVCDAIIALFTNSKTNPNGAQLIATTHDTNLFNAPHLRRDELWLVEKSPGGASEFYSLADVKVRDVGNYERGYLQGRYGAIPFAGSAIDLVKRL